MISILIPTVGRPDRLAGLAANIHDTTVAEHEIVFIVEEDDQASIAAILDAGEHDRFHINLEARSYAGACNSAYLRHRLGELIFTGADDLHFHHGWDVEAMAHLDDQVLVVGTNDRLNPYVAKGWHATHYLIDRRYLDTEGGCVDAGPGSFLHEGYSHNFTDTEFIGTAKARARFRPCLEAVVEHLHHSAGRMAPDATTEKTQAGYGADAELYDRRKELWWNLSR